MANIKVSEMTEATSFDDGDYTMIVQANQNKKISKENILGDIENNIGNLTELETTDKSNIVKSINEVNAIAVNNEKNNVYSETEIDTGKKWLNNKSIYKKTILLSSPSTINQWITVTTLPYETLIDIHGNLIASSGRYVSINYSEPNFEIITSVINGEIQMKVLNSNWTAKQVIMFVEYTKSE